MESGAMWIDWAKLVAETVVSWPAAIIVCALLFKNSIREVIPNLTSGKIGPVEWHTAAQNLERATEASQELAAMINNLQILIAQTRIVEIEIFLDNFTDGASSKQKQTLTEAVEKMKMALNELEASKIEGAV